MTRFSFTAAQEQDKADPLAALRNNFHLPENIIYLDGNSLGALPKNVIGVVNTTITKEWGNGLIRSWNDADWIRLPQRIGGKIAPLIGNAPHQVIMADSTSVNLFKTLSAACALRPSRKKIVTEKLNFPTDNYIAQGVVQQLSQGHELVYVDDPEDIITALSHDVAVVMLTHVNYRDGRMLDMGAITKPPMMLAR